MEHYDSKNGAAQEATAFSPETILEHRRLKMAAWRHIWNTRLMVIVSSPLIYGCVFPFLLLDFAVSVYQRICFSIYGIPMVQRNDYLIFDRGRLAYLNVIEKIACIYCSYANGLLAYVTEIAARTEQHFCPIKHARRNLRPHSRYAHLLPYGDARAYRSESEAVSNDYSDLITIRTK